MGIRGGEEPDPDDRRVFSATECALEDAVAKKLVAKLEDLHEQTLSTVTPLAKRLKLLSDVEPEQGIWDLTTGGSSASRPSS